MARFNQTTKGTVEKPNTTNRSGGAAYAVAETTEMIGLIWTSFCADSFYSKWVATLTRLRTLVAKYPELAAYAALVARKKFGLRSVTHVVAALVAHEARGAEWLRPFLYAIIHRPDDITEILAVRSQLGLPKAIPHSMRRAFADRIAEFNEYQMAKYRGDDKVFTMKDAVFLCHPRHTEATEALVAGTLKNTDTWEARGNSLETWVDLLGEGKLGYLALLRNLRNMLAYKDQTLNALVCNALRNERAIRKGLIMPHQFVRAVDALTNRTWKLSSARDRTRPVPPAVDLPQRVYDALVEATDMCLGNLPNWEGTTVIGLDASGSMRPEMDAHYKRKPGRDPWTTARTFAAGLMRRCENPILLPFTSEARVTPMPTLPTLVGQEWIDEKVPSGGTAMASVFLTLRDRKVKADRVLLLTDEESWAGGTGYSAFKQWRDMTGCNPILHSVDLESYGTCQFPESRTNIVYGWNSHLFNILEALERREVGNLADYCMQLTASMTAESSPLVHLDSQSGEEA